MTDRIDERPTTDARKTLRTPLSTLKVKVDDGRKAFFGYATNISRSGMFIRSSNPKDLGERFEVEIPLPAPLNREVRCSCEVVWQRQYSKSSSYEPGMGLNFVDMPQELADSIDSCVRDQYPAEKG